MKKFLYICSMFEIENLKKMIDVLTVKRDMYTEELQKNKDATTIESDKDFMKSLGHYTVTDDLIESLNRYINNIILNND